MKQYKHNTPEETVNKIRGILSSIDILLLEKHIINSNRYSCRVSIGNNGLADLNIGTNGKGRSFEYSLASGYAEFAERLQNRILLDAHRMVSDKTFNSFSFANDANAAVKYTFAPEEKEINPEDFSPVVKREIRRCCRVSDDTPMSKIFQTKNEDDGEVCIPFYDDQNQTEEWFPINFVLRVTGSNGMASGNTPKEAVLQAICEVFERYVIRELYYKNITPPEIPLSEFKGTDIYDRLVEYKATTGHELIIKDCSLGIGLPAVGLAIIDRESQSYYFKVGVDFVPSVALERCFTETFQGRKKLDGLPYNFTDYNNDKYKTAGELEDNLMKLFVTGTGVWPSCVVLGGGEPTYPFKGFDPAYGQSNKQDYEIARRLIRNNGSSLYIRDNSVLGFPSYFVLVPGMSEITERNPLDPSYQFRESMLNLEEINHLGRLTPEMARSIMVGIKENYDLIKSEDFKLKHVLVYNVNKDLCDLEINMLAALLSCYLGNMDDCVKYLTSYLKGKDKGTYRYYYACLDYLKTRNALNPETALKTVALLYGEELAAEVAGDFKDNRAIFQYYKLPNCPDCDKCRLVDECRNRQIQTIKRKITEIELKNNIRQINLKEALSNDEE